jgi:hypothetical protein
MGDGRAWTASTACTWARAATWRRTEGDAHLRRVLGRAEWRDAFVWLSDERAYLTKSWRATAGARLTFNSHVVLKAEYLLNGEYYAGPQVPNDVFTSSLLLSY